MPLHESENIVLQQLCATASISEADISQLRHIAARHPYFGMAHFFVAKHSLQQHSPQAEEDVQKAALHFNNTPWLQYLLKENNNNLEEDKSLNAEFAGTEHISTEDKIFLKDDAVLHNIEESSGKEIINESGEKITIVSAPVIAEENSAINKENEKDNAAIDEINIIEITKDANAVSSSAITEENSLISQQQQPEGDENELRNAETDALINSRIGSILQQQAAEMNKPVTDETNLPVEIQQHYRSDYFASQGIKLENVQNANDQLGNKLKKFTDWLRQMKRIQPNPSDLGTDTTTEKLIQHIAENSNETKEIVTETMAEVLLKQQKTEHAIDIYKKLSLSHPEKETYFAVKINEIKNLS